jgi:GUN4-like/TIR domain
MSQDTKKVFISYAWGGDSEEFVNRLDHAFQEKGITIIRDKRDLGYKGLIKEFMEQIGRGKCVIAVISDKYLKSPNCMFELVQVAKDGEFYNRIFPIVLADAQIYDPVQRLKYIKHWEDKKKELNEAIKEVGAEYLQGVREEIDRYTEIRNTIAELTDILKNMNTLTPDLHSHADFETLFKTIELNLSELDLNDSKSDAQKTSESHDRQVIASSSEIRSEYKVDLTRLENLLKAGQWQEANQETAWLMLSISGKQGQKWLFKEDIENFPRLDFQTIDSLWTKYSKGKFGFSVQKKIWYECGKPRFYSDDWMKLGERLGWRKGNFFKKEWIYGAASFDISAPLGHLPLTLMDLEYPPEQWGAGDLVRTCFLRHDL